MHLPPGVRRNNGLNGVRQVGRIVRAAGVAKDYERINFFFVPTDQDDTTVARM